MPELIDYQPQLPDGLQLRYLTAGDTVRISRDSVSRSLLWIEACTPLVILLPVVVVAMILNLHRPRGLFANQLPLWVSALQLLMILLVPALLLLLVGRNLRQNMGIVVEIAVSPKTFYWRKQNLWGDKEYFWPLESVKSVGVWQSLLRVERHRGPRLSAFSFCRPAELAHAAALLHQTIERNR